MLVPIAKKCSICGERYIPTKEPHCDVASMGRCQRIMELRNELGKADARLAVLQARRDLAENELRLEMAREKEDQCWRKLTSE